MEIPIRKNLNQNEKESLLRSSLKQEIQGLEVKKQKIENEVAAILQVISKNGLTPKDPLITNKTIEKCKGLDFFGKLERMITNLNEKIKIAPENRAKVLNTEIPKLQAQWNLLNEIDQQIQEKKLEIEEIDKQATAQAAIAKEERNKPVENIPVFYPLESAQTYIELNGILSEVDLAFADLKKASPKEFENKLYTLANSAGLVFDPYEYGDKKVPACLKTNEPNWNSLKDWRSRVASFMEEHIAIYNTELAQYEKFNSRLKSTQGKISIAETNEYSQNISTLTSISRETYALNRLLESFDFRSKLKNEDEIDDEDILQIRNQKRDPKPTTYENAFGLQRLFIDSLNTDKTLEPNAVEVAFGKLSEFTNNPNRYFDQINQDNLHYPNLVDNDIKIKALKATPPSQAGFTQVKSLLSEWVIFKKNFEKFAPDFQIVAQVFAGNGHQYDTEEINDAFENLKIYGIYVGSAVKKFEFLQHQLESQLELTNTSKRKLQEKLEKNNLPDGTIQDTRAKIDLLEIAKLELEKNIQITSFFFDSARYLDQSVELPQTKYNQLIEKQIATETTSGQPEYDSLSEREKALWDTWMGGEYEDDWLEEDLEEEFEDDEVSDEEEIKAKEDSDLPTDIKVIRPQTDAQGAVVESPKKKKVREQISNPKKVNRYDSSSNVRRNKFPARAPILPYSNPEFSLDEQRFMFPGIADVDYLEELRKISKLIMLVKYFQVNPSRVLRMGYSQEDLTNLSAKLPLLELTLKSYSEKQRYHTAEISTPRLLAIENELMKICYKKLVPFIGANAKNSPVYDHFKQIYSGVEVLESGKAGRDCFPERGQPDYKAIAYYEFYHAHKYPDRPSVYKRLIEKQRLANISGSGFILHQSELDFINLVESYKNDRILQTIRGLSYYFGVMDAEDKPSNKLTKKLSEGLRITYQDKLEKRQTELEEELAVLANDGANNIKINAKNQQILEVIEDFELLESDEINNPELIKIISKYGIEKPEIYFVNQYLAHNAYYITPLRKEFTQVYDKEGHSKAGHSQVSQYMISFPIIDGPHVLAAHPLPVTSVISADNSFKTITHTPTNPSGTHIKLERGENGEIVKIMIVHPVRYRDTVIKGGKKIDSVIQDDSESSDNAEEGLQEEGSAINGDGDENPNIPNVVPINTSQPTARNIQFVDQNNHNSTDPDKKSKSKPTEPKKTGVETLEGTNSVVSVYLTKEQIDQIRKGSIEDFIEITTNHKKTDKRVRRKKPVETSKSPSESHRNPPPSTLNPTNKVGGTLNGSTSSDNTNLTNQNKPTTRENVQIAAQLLFEDLLKNNSGLSEQDFRNLFSSLLEILDKISELDPAFDQSNISILNKIFSKIKDIFPKDDRVTRFQLDPNSETPLDDQIFFIATRENDDTLTIAYSVVGEIVKLFEKYLARTQLLQENQRRIEKLDRKIEKQDLAHQPLLLELYSNSEAFTKYRVLYQSLKKQMEKQNSYENENLRTIERLENWFKDFCSQNNISPETVGEQRFQAFVDYKQNIVNNLDFAGWDEYNLHKKAYSGQSNNNIHQKMVGKAPFNFIANGWQKMGFQETDATIALHHNLIAIADEILPNYKNNLLTTYSRWRQQTTQIFEISDVLLKEPKEFARVYNRNLVVSLISAMTKAKLVLDGSILADPEESAGLTTQTDVLLKDDTSENTSSTLPKGSALANQNESQADKIVLSEVERSDLPDSIKALKDIHQRISHVNRDTPKEDLVRIAESLPSSIVATKTKKRLKYDDGNQTFVNAHAIFAGSLDNNTRQLAGNKFIRIWPRLIDSVKNTFEPSEYAKIEKILDGFPFTKDYIPNHIFTRSAEAKEAYYDNLDILPQVVERLANKLEELADENIQETSDTTLSAHNLDLKPKNDTGENLNSALQNDSALANQNESQADNKDKIVLSEVERSHLPESIKVLRDLHQRISHVNRDTPKNELVEIARNLPLISTKGRLKIVEYEKSPELIKAMTTYSSGLDYNIQDFRDRFSRASWNAIIQEVRATFQVSQYNKIERVLVDFPFSHEYLKVDTFAFERRELIPALYDNLDILPQVVERLANKLEELANENSLENSGEIILNPEEISNLKSHVRTLANVGKLFDGLSENSPKEVLMVRANESIGFAVYERISELLSESEKPVNSLSNKELMALFINATSNNINDIRLGLTIPTWDQLVQRVYSRFDSEIFGFINTKYTCKYYSNVYYEYISKKKLTVDKNTLGTGGPERFFKEFFQDAPKFINTLLDELRLLNLQNIEVSANEEKATFFNPYAEEVWRDYSQSVESILEVLQHTSGKELEGEIVKFFFNRHIDGREEHNERVGRFGLKFAFLSAIFYSSRNAGFKTLKDEDNWLKIVNIALQEIPIQDQAVLRQACRGDFLRFQMIHLNDTFAKQNTDKLLEITKQFLPKLIEKVDLAIAAEKQTIEVSSVEATDTTVPANETEATTLPTLENQSQTVLIQGSEKFWQNEFKAKVLTSTLPLFEAKNQGQLNQILANLSLELNFPNTEDFQQNTASWGYRYSFMNVLLKLISDNIKYVFKNESDWMIVRDEILQTIPANKKNQVITFCTDGFLVFDPKKYDNTNYQAKGNQFWQFGPEFIGKLIKKIDRLYEKQGNLLSEVPSSIPTTTTTVDPSLDDYQIESLDNLDLQNQTIEATSHNNFENLIFTPEQIEVWYRTERPFRESLLDCKNLFEQENDYNLRKALDKFYQKYQIDKKITNTRSHLTESLYLTDSVIQTLSKNYPLSKDSLITKVLSSFSPEEYGILSTWSNPLFRGNKRKYNLSVDIMAAKEFSIFGPKFIDRLVAEVDHICTVSAEQNSPTPLITPVASEVIMEQTPETTLDQQKVMEIADQIIGKIEFSHDEILSLNTFIDDLRKVTQVNGTKSINISNSPSFKNFNKFIVEFNRFNTLNGYALPVLEHKKFKSIISIYINIGEKGNANLDLAQAVLVELSSRTSNGSENVT